MRFGKFIVTLSVLALASTLVAVQAQETHKKKHQEGEKKVERKHEKKQDEIAEKRAEKGDREKKAGQAMPGDTVYRQFVRNAELQAVVGISPQQAEKLKALDAEYPLARGENASLSGEEKAKAAAENREKNKEMQKKFKEILTPEQNKKFNVLRFQLTNGLDGMLNGEVLEALDPTNDQKKEIAAVLKEQESKAKEWRTKGPQAEGFKEAMQKHRQETKAKIEAILTEAQKERAAKLVLEGQELRKKIRKG